MMKIAITAAMLVMVGVWGLGPAVLTAHEHGAKVGVGAAESCAAACMGKMADLDAAVTAAPVAEPASPYVNAFCPIRNVKIDPAKVTPEKTREWKGQKVAFCCPGCPAKWDKMTDEQKQAALDKVTPKPSPTPVPEGTAPKAHRTGGGCGCK